METDDPKGGTKEAVDDRAATELRQDIASKRADMTATMTALEQKLNPADLREKAVTELHNVEDSVKAVAREQIQEVRTMLKHDLADAKETAKQELQSAFQNAKQSMRDATLGRVEGLVTQAGDIMNDARDSLFQTVRSNPLPAALTGIGIMWLLMNRSNAAAARTRGLSFGDGAGTAIGGMAHRASDTASSAFHSATDAAGRLAQQTSDAAGQIAHRAGDAAGYVSDEAQELAGSVAKGARRFERVLGDTLHERPMVLGAVALAVGAAVALSLPRTEREDALMGEARDQLVHKAGDMSTEAAQAVQQLTAKAGDGVKGALKDGPKP